MARSSPVSNEQKHARSNGREQAAAARHESGSERAELLKRVDAYWRAANYLAVGQIYLMDNPLLREPLRPERVAEFPLIQEAFPQGHVQLVRSRAPDDELLSTLYIVPPQPIP